MGPSRSSPAVREESGTTSSHSNRRTPSSSLSSTTTHAKLRDPGGLLRSNAFTAYSSLSKTDWASVEAASTSAPVLEVRDGDSDGGPGIEREELEARDMIDELIEQHDLEAASDFLRVDIYDFFGDEHPDDSEKRVERGDAHAHDDIDDDSGDASDTSSESSIRFLISAPLSEVPLEWRRRFYEGEKGARHEKQQKEDETKGQDAVNSTSLKSKAALAAGKTVNDESDNQKKEESKTHEERAAAAAVVPNTRPSRPSKVRFISQLPSIRRSDQSSAIMILRSPVRSKQPSVPTRRPLVAPKTGGDRPSTRLKGLIKAQSNNLSNKQGVDSGTPITVARPSVLQEKMERGEHDIDKEGSRPGAARGNARLYSSSASAPPHTPSEPTDASVARISDKSKVHFPTSSAQTHVADPRPDTAGSETVRAAVPVKPTVDESNPSLREVRNCSSSTISSPMLSTPSPVAGKVIMRGKIVVLRVTNLPWTITANELVQWLGNALESCMLAPNMQISSVHIPCDRAKGRTKAPAFVECTSQKVAQQIVAKKNAREFQGRKIRVAIGQRRELMGAIFPTWEKAGFSSKEHTPILSSAEVEGLKELCKLKAPFIKQTPERAYMDVLSIAAKFPWRNHDVLDATAKNTEQSKVLQLIRECYKLLNQYGKGMPQYEKIETLFSTFLESHGGITGSLRTVPVDPSICPAPSPHRISLKAVPKKSYREVALELALPPGQTVAHFHESHTAQGHLHLTSTSSTSSNESKTSHLPVSDSSPDRTGEDSSGDDKGGPCPSPFSENAPDVTDASEKNHNRQSTLPPLGGSSAPYPAQDGTASLDGKRLLEKLLKGCRDEQATLSRKTTSSDKDVPSTSLTSNSSPQKEGSSRTQESREDQATYSYSTPNKDPGESIRLLREVNAAYDREQRFRKLQQRKQLDAMRGGRAAGSFTNAFSALPSDAVGSSGVSELSSQDQSKAPLPSIGTRCDRPGDIEGHCGVPSDATSCPNATLASSHSPEVISRPVYHEELFTPPRFNLARPSSSSHDVQAGFPARHSPDSRDCAVARYSSASSYSNGGGVTNAVPSNRSGVAREAPDKTHLDALAEELGIEKETIKKLVQRLGSMV